MKNIFKFMGIALMACSLTVACGDKDNENDNEGGEGGGNTTTTSVSVNFNGQNQGTMNSIQAAYNANYAVCVFDFFAEAQTFPGVEIYLNSSANGQSTATYDVSSMNLTGGDCAICEFYESTSLRDGDGLTYGDWWAAEANSNVTAMDLTNLKASFTVNATMFWALEAYVEEAGQVGYDAATRAPMTVAASNITLQ
ncbi:MAG: hypothetical protein IJ634_01765 [Bacteroidales bacterium]|nr:hypothetical protein [Bacteroidales bacterium]